VTEIFNKRNTEEHEDGLFTEGNEGNEGWRLRDFVALFGKIFPSLASLTSAKESVFVFFC
jgi:hypothetical protein